MPASRYAVLLGNGIYLESQTRLPALRCPVQDVEGMKETLSSERHGGYQVTSAIDATHTAGRRAIFDALRKATSDDLVLIYYSGHGKLDEDGNLYLATADTEVDALPPTSISVADIKRYISDSNAASVIVVLDCCYSGSIKKLFKGDISGQATLAVKGFGGKGVFYLSASTDTQLAEEKETDKYSLLTKHIIAGISAGGADRNGDGEISFHELCLHVESMVRSEGRQRPQHWSLDAEGDLVIALSGKPAFQHQRELLALKLHELASQGVITSRIVTNLLSSLSDGNNLDGSLSAKCRDLIQSLYLLIDTRAPFIERCIELSTARVGVNVSAVKIEDSPMQPISTEPEQEHTLQLTRSNPIFRLQLVKGLIWIFLIGVLVYMAALLLAFKKSNLFGTSKVSVKPPVSEILNAENAIQPLKLIQEGPPQNWAVHYNMDGTFIWNRDQVTVKVTSGLLEIGNGGPRNVRFRSLNLGLCSANTSGQWDIYPHETFPDSSIPLTKVSVSQGKSYKLQPHEFKLPVPQAVEPQDLWVCSLLWTNIGGNFPAHEQFRRTLNP